MECIDCLNSLDTGKESLPGQAPDRNRYRPTEDTCWRGLVDVGGTSPAPSSDRVSGMGSASSRKGNEKGLRLSRLANFDGIAIEISWQMKKN